jgi:hypothetical protein
MFISINSETTTLTSDHNIHRIDIASHITDKLDVRGIRINQFPDELDEMRISIGYDVSVTFKKVDQERLASFPIYVSKIPYQTVIMEFIYNKEWLMTNEVAMQNEEENEEIIKGELVEVFIKELDSYHWGKLVTRRMVSTGKKVRKVIKGEIVQVPALTFNVEETSEENPPPVPYLERLDTGKTTTNVMIYRGGHVVKMYSF